MQLKVLLQGRFIVAAVMVNDDCPSESFITEGEAAYEASRDGLTDLLSRISEHGLSNLSSKQTHEVDKERKIYELIKGDLRLFYFKGQGDVVVICTSGSLKKGQKVDKKAVNAAAKLQDEYKTALKKNNIEWVADPEE